jgi:polar amino acid transport system substrate-binding protein
MVLRFVLALALACLAVPALAQESQLDVVLKRDKLIIGTYSTSPLAFVDDNGDLVGFEIDLAHELAKDLLGDPKKVDFVVLQSDGRFPAVLSGKIDVGMCSTTITPDRAIRIAFTYPYIDAGSVLLARKDAHIGKIQELNDPKYTYAILNVPPAIERTKRVLPNVKQLLLDSPSALFLAVKTGRATAFSIDKPIADFYVGENEDLVRVDTAGTELHFVNNDSFYLKPGDSSGGSTWTLTCASYGSVLAMGNTRSGIASGCIRIHRRSARTTPASTDRNSCRSTCTSLAD